MNILVLGNGFDLAHYLPTSYANIMTVFSQIRSHAGDSASFSDLFSTLKNEGMLAVYDTDNICFDLKTFKVTGLLDNPWLDYFDAHMSIETWIDFENEIERALEAVIQLDNALKNALLSKSELTNYLYCNEIDASNANGVFLNTVHQQTLRLLRIASITSTLRINTDFSKPHSLKPSEPFTPTSEQLIPSTVSRIEKTFCIQNNSSEFINGFDSSRVLSYLSTELIRFIELFDLYFSQILSQFYQHKKSEINFSLTALFLDKQIRYFNRENESESIVFERVLSFNYTPTFEEFYSDLIKVDQRNKGVVEHVHGNASNTTNPIQSIVLGVNDITDNLKKHKAFSFTKYYQKLFNKTDCHFLSSWIEQIDAKHIRFSESIQIYVWGHSLDLSDEIYIKQIFEFLDKTDGQLTVFHHNKITSGNLLSNLLKIMGQTIIESFMLKDKLLFQSSENTPIVINNNPKNKDFI
jgi:hypothetical protein